MRLSTKSRFAVTAMIDVALREDRGPVSLAAISERHQISLSYLEQLFSKLRQSGLVESTRGPGGGYSLGRSADLISMADILSAVDAPTADEAADEQSSWMNSDLWSSLNHQMLAHLQSIKLRQLVAEQRAKGVAIEPAPTKAASVKRGVFARKPEPLKVTAPNSVFALAGSLVPSRG
jgi:Rrf2 family transcriptional regulator, iron-sulfur cluster assembly transcription factor